MKLSINQRELALLDGLAVQADRLHQLEAALIESFRRSLDVQPYEDCEDDGVVARYVKAGALLPVEALLASLDMFVEEDVT